MRLVTTDAIVLRSYNLAESDRIVVFLTRSSGLVRAVAKGARKMKSRFGAALEPFTLVKLSFHERENRDLVSLSGAEILKSHRKDMLAKGLYRADGYVFCTGTGAPMYARNVAERGLRKAGDRAGLNPGGKPRVTAHDLRHSFAVHRLTAWYRRGADVQRLLPVISTYLGHSDLEGTKVYLSMTPELLQQASLRFARYARGGQDA